MNVSDFTYLLQNPELINQEGIIELEKIIHEYPFFQATLAIYLKGLKDQDSFKYNKVLKKTAALTTDRTVLFDFITSESFIQNDIAKNISEKKEIIEDIIVNPETVNPIVEIDLGTQIEAEAILDPLLFEKKEIPETPTTPSEEETKILAIGKPLEFNKNEQHSFSEWLKISQAKPIVREQEENNETDSKAIDKEKKFALIDKFIEKSPKITPNKETTSSINLAKQNLVEKSELMTETLARVYLEQKKYKKAIQAYSILSLKYPEKSGFFADRIRAVKKLQQNN